MKLGILLVSFVIAASASATTHVIKFGNTLGLIYQPQFLTGVAVGDTIKWEGHFQYHPLVSTLIPPSAEPFANNGLSHDTSMIYIPLYKGAYGYFCTAHGSIDSGMYGGFLVESLGVDDEENIELATFPNPSSNTLNILFTLTQPGSASISVFDIHGKEALATSGTYGIGKNSAVVNVASLPVGMYYYRLETLEGLAVRKFAVMR